ncbi:conjugal transfer protein [Streptomyces sp. NPDC000229]|uniref:conjugal transfer protein n=1 Tax=Streptomyces sp. NPDC000229 TaxID=3154247 RepID=UPI00331B1480
MKHLLTRRPAKEAPDQQPDLEEMGEWDIDEEPPALGGWSTGAQANTAAIFRWAAWGLLLLGPLLGVAAYLAVPSKAPSGEVKTAPAAPVATGGQGAAGFAQLFVADYISAGEGDQKKLAAYYPAATSARLEGTPGRRMGEQLTVVRLRQTATGVWAVTVAARITEKDSKPSPAQQRPAAQADVRTGGTIRFFQVPVASAPVGGGATGYTALAMPAEVGAPARIEAPDLVYGPMRPALPTDPRTQAVTEFLTAYLTGTGQLDRYLAPGTQLTAITPAPYTGVAVDQLAIEGEKSAAPVTTVPGDGTRLRLLVALRATGHDTVRVPLTYALTLKARAGRWEIASLDGAPVPAPPVAGPSAAATPTP